MPVKNNKARAGNRRLVIAGMEDGKRVSSRLLEERVQRAVREEGARNVLVRANGQQGQCFGRRGLDKLRGHDNRAGQRHQRRP
ncbi:MAG: hypothetical protein P8Y39_12540 [Nitrospirota bacterium]